VGKMGIFDILSQPNTQWVLFGSMLLGFASGTIGSFVFLKKQSLISDAMAHATLPGVCIMYMIFKVKSIPLFLIGAAITGLLATYSIQAIVNKTRIKTDAAIGTTLSVFFALGIVLLTYISQHYKGNHSGLDDFIFGQAAALVRIDILMVAAGSIVIIILTSLFFKEFKITIFDPQFAKGIGLPVTFINGVLLALVIGIVVIGIQLAGVVLISALLITPPLAARYWTEKLGTMTILSGVFGGLSGMLGTYASTIGYGLPTGPVIVLTASVAFLISLIFGSKKGLIRKVVKTG
jgi:manganese/zinc/iron transport system permease protein